MAYVDFHQRNPDHSTNDPPIFYDTDGSPVYESEECTLIQEIIIQNDIAALYSYYNGPRKRDLFREARGFELNCDNPFSVAFSARSFDVLYVLIQLYLLDSTLEPLSREPLQEYLNHFHVSLIHEACASGNKELVLWILNHSPPLGTLHDRDYRDRTPLFRTAEALGHLVTAGNSPILASQKMCERRDLLEKLMIWLLESGCLILESNIRQRYKDDGPRSVLGAAIPYASYDLVTYLITKGADIYAQQYWFDCFSLLHQAYEVTVLHIAAHYWNLEGIQAIIDNCGEMASLTDSEGRLPLHWALIGNASISELNPHCYGQYDEDISTKIMSRMTNIMKILLDANPDGIHIQDQHGNTAFHHAVTVSVGEIGITTAVNLLLATKQPSGTKPLSKTLSTPNHQGITVMRDLISSFYAGSLQDLMVLVWALLANGANARLCDNIQRNVLQILCSYHWLQPITSVMLHPLLGLVDINETDADGRSVLHYLVNHLDQIEAARYLISRGADVNAIDNKGNTPLHEVMKGSLLKRDENGNRVWGIEKRPEIVRSARDELKQVLLDAGAVKIVD